ncbi:conserved hypothetical protein [Talaromyces stipitatus ATCC 10500]|uniref:Alcohol acetyltransferase n=1 Tax=Talaromyces stipitatus (strain ATCC 10500 / CBS 375.48 / QM 6759 / NRRL 1006) TaxID=441959 RepID=B8MMK0_TALSN|nr:uncharacterized protein TSTA_100000 [Talaromyces stipitatus ATCC 10500]EED13754.1 conserved hypothetical protein [Talaromyces stipitatus ATCC 10500]
MEDKVALRRLRFAGRLEKYLTARHFLGFYSNVAVSAFYSHPSPLDVGHLQTLVYKALKELIADHPALGVSVADEDKARPYYMQLPTVDFSETVTFIPSNTIPDPSDPKGADALDLLLEEQHNHNFKDKMARKPLWRLLIVHKPTESSQFVACFVYHHSISDGTSGLVFHRHFRRKLSQISIDDLKQKEGVIVKTSSKALLPALEDLHPLPLSIRYLLKAFWENYIASTKSKQRGLWPAAPVTGDPTKRRCRFRSVRFSQETTSQLVAACRANSTSLTAAAQTILAASLFANLPLDQFSRLHCDGAVSFRRWLPVDMVDKDSIGNWISQYHHEYRFIPKNETSPIDAIDIFSWEEARKAKATIQKEVDKQGKDSVVGLLKLAGNLHKYFQSKIGKPRAESFETSNIGTLGCDQQEVSDEKSSWTIGRVVFGQGAEVTGAALEASFVTGNDGCLNVGFSWFEEIVERSIIEKVIVTFKRTIEEVVSKHNSTVEIPQQSTKH